MKSIIIASTSTVYGSGFLDYLMDELKTHFKNANSILFIPYARPSGISHEVYTEKVSKTFAAIGKKVKGIHEFENPKSAIDNAEGIFVGGGNTFVLVNELYKNNCLLPIKIAVEKGIPYLGTSAGSNICGLTINTTNDMPIVYPPSFKTLGLVPFNINPHYLDPNPDSTHMGETREMRINEFHTYNTLPVIGLREGGWIEVKGSVCTLRGNLNARIFELNKAAYELTTNSDLGFLK